MPTLIICLTLAVAAGYFAISTYLWRKYARAWVDNAKEWKRIAYQNYDIAEANAKELDKLTRAMEETFKR